MVNKYYPPHLGGIEFHMRDLAESLAARDGATVRAIVSNEAPKDAEEDINGVHVMRLQRYFSAASTPIARGMNAQLRDEARDPERRPDVFHLHFPYPWGEVSWLWSKTGVPTVLTYHSDIVRQKMGLALYHRYLNRVLDEVDLIIASSPNMVEHSEYLAPRAHKCRVVPFGIHTERYEATPQVIARAAALKAAREGRKIVLFVGRLIYYKGADVLVRAMANIDAELVMIGRGPLEGELREIAAANGSAGRITFLGPQPDDELVAWYHAADVFCLPSVARSEAFGLVQIEAHAAGTPVISTRLTTGVPFANLDGVTGLTVEPGDVAGLADALNRILTDDELRTRLAVQARDRAHAEFSIPRMTEQTLDVYREAIALHERRRS